MKSSKKPKLTIWAIVSQLRLTTVLFFLVVFAGLAAFIGIEVTSHSSFCNSCHIMNDYYASWERSTHSEVECLKCHLQPGFTNYMVGKINGLAQSVDCMVGRVGTKAEATVFDVSCLRSDCHSVEKLVENDILFGNVKFSHKGHIQETFGGISVSCGTCHSHYEGDEHFSVQKEICFSCHFVKSSSTSPGVVNSKCLDCHNVPDKVIQRGLVKVDHREFVSYEASCEDSCHKRQIEHISQVSDEACLSCHSHGIGPDDTPEHLHEAHTTHEKVECFACHGKVMHGPDQAGSVAGMIRCQNCHSDTHGIQQTIFKADRPITHVQNKEKILSPMFLTHVECSDCHIETTSAKSGTLDSLGAVARAVPKACDNCHEAGTGDRYVPFWQKRIKELYAQASEKLKKAENNAQKPLSDGTRLQIQKAAEILDSIAADGSWGVHNLKYTEALLLQVNDIVNKIE